MFECSLDIIWNNSDIATNVPGKSMSCLDRSLYLNSFIGMTDDVRWVLESDGCIPERLCKLFSYNFERNSLRCCSHCDLRTST